MIKLLFFIESLSGGGAENALVTLIGSLDKEKYDIYLVPLVDMGAFKEGVDTNAVHYLPVIPSSSGILSALWGKIKYKLIYRNLPLQFVFKWIMPRMEFDWSIAFVEGFSTKLMAHAPGRKIAWAHTDLAKNPWPLQLGIFKDLKEEIDTYACYDKVVCVSRVVEDTMKRLYGLQNTTTLYNIVDRNRIVSLSQLPQQITLSPGFNIVAVGRLVPQKRFDKLIQIVARLRREGADAHLYLVGDGPDRAHLERLSCDNGTEDAVIFTGFLKNPYPLMRNSDLMVSPARAEGFGLVVAEAMVLGLPVIGMNDSGTAELLGNGRYGELCDSDDALAAAIRNAACNAGYLKELENRSRQGQAQFDLQKAVEQIESLFDRDA